MFSIYWTQLARMEQIHVHKSSFLIVYRMDRLCGGTHEISGIHAPLFLWVGG